MGVLTFADLRTLALLCEALAQEAELRATLRREGMLIDAGTSRKAHPAARGLEAVRASCTKLLTEFGLSPRSRLSIELQPFVSNEPRSKLAKYLT
jgi:P27 family predicted phage terminase small subunit